MDSRQESAFSELVQEALRKDMSLINEFYVFFEEDISLEDFQSGVLKLDQKGKNLVNSLMYVLESKQIITKYDSIRMVLLFVAIETLMSDSKFFSFNDWLLTSKEVLGQKKRDVLLRNINLREDEDFKSLIRELAEEYSKYYGVTNKVRDFFVNYLDYDSKKRLICSILFYRKDCDKFVYKCFMSKDKCLIDAHSDCCKRNPECVLNKEASINDVLIKFVGFIYGYYRNSFVHEGELSNITDENIFCCIDYYQRDRRYIKIYLSYESLKEIVIKGIKTYYFQHCL
jgi:hypothetical protein